MHLYDIHLYLCIICKHITAFYDDFNKWMQLARGVLGVYKMYDVVTVSNTQGTCR